MTKQMAAAPAGAKHAAVRTEPEKELTGLAEPGLARAVPKTLAFQTMTSFSNKALAGSVVEAGFARPGSPR